MPLKTTIENPLEVRDRGSFELDRLIREPSIKDLLNTRESNKLNNLLKEKNLLKDEVFDKYGHILGTEHRGEYLDSDMFKKVLEQRGDRVDALQKILNKRGYDSMRYKNTGEVDNAARSVIPMFEDTADEIETLRQDLKYHELTDAERAEKEAVLKGKEEQLGRMKNLLPDSYALFPNHPLRHFDAAFDPSKIKKNPNKLLYSGAGAALAPLLVENAEAGETKPVNLIEKNPLEVGKRVLETVDNVTGKPIRKYVYEKLSDNEKENPSGSDIIEALETKLGRPVPEVSGATLKMKDMLGLAADVGLS